MVSPIIAVVGVFTASAYAAGAVIHVRSLIQNSEANLKLLWAITIPSLAAHGLVNVWLVSTPAGINLGLFTSASLVTWIMICFVTAFSLRLPVQNMLVIVLPLGAVSLCAALAFESTYTPITVLGQGLAWHILLSILAYSILFMAACQSVLLGILEDRLRHRQTFALVRLLPPLQTMDSLLFNLLWAGVVTLTLAILSGFLFLDDLFAQRVVHHTVLAIASWFVYATLLIGRQLLGWRGSTAVRWTLIAFSLLVLGYFGSKFVIEILLGG